MHAVANPIPMFFWTHYLWYIEPPTHDIVNSPPMVYQTPYPSYLDHLPMVYRTPYPWYFDPPTLCILKPLPIVYQTPCLRYFDLPTHGISNPLPRVFWTPYSWYIGLPYMVYQTPYPWHFDPLPMVHRTPFPWYFEPLTHILLPLPISWLEMRGVQNIMGVESTIQRGSVFNKGVQYTMDENWSRGQYTMGFKIP